MRTTHLATLILMFFISRAYALDNVILNPRGTSITQRILSYKDYDDIRIDKDLDGFVDEWFIRKNETQIQVSYKQRKINSLKIVSFRGTNVLIKKFQNLNGRLLLTKSESRAVNIMHGSSSEMECDDSKSTLAGKVADLSGDINAVLAQSNSPKSCKLQEYPQFSENLAAMGIILNADRAKISECLEKAGTLDGVDLHLVSAKMKLAIEKISTGNAATIYSCEFSKNTEVTGQASEDGKIKFSIPTNGKDPLVDPSNVEHLFVHELLHASGVQNETTAKSITTDCLNDGVIGKEASRHQPSTSAENVETSLAATLDDQSIDNGEIGKAKPKSNGQKKETSSIAKSAAKTGDGLNMKSEIANAEAIIPSASKLNVASTDKSPAGKEAALRESVSESTPVFRMANQVMGASNTPAIADSSDSSSSSSSYSSQSYSSSEVSGSSGSSRSGSSKSTGRRYQSRYGRYQSKDGVGSDEYVAEEIDLTKNVDAQTSRNRQQATRQPASKSYQSDTQGYQPSAQESSGSRGPASTTDEVSKGKKTIAGARSADGAAAVGGSAGSGSANLDNGSAGGGGGATASNGRNPKNAKAASASRAPASANQGSPAQRRELMDTLKDDNYVLMKRRLKEQSFQDELSSNGITVVDSYGGKYGATQGAVIYRDTGDRFLRER